MNIYKKLTKIFESSEPLDDEIDDMQEPDIDAVPELDVPQSQEAESESEPEIAGAGDAKRERTAADSQLKQWYGIPNAQPGKTLDDLKVLDWKNGVTPEKAGWTFDEVLAAMKPSIMDKANYVSSSNPNLSKDEAVSAGIMAIHSAWKKDAGKSAFPSYAYRWMDSIIRREAAAANKMKSGGQSTYDGKLDWRGLKGQQTMSADVEDASGDAHSANIPAEETAADTNKGFAGSLIHKLIDSPAVELSDTEKLVIRATYGIKKDGSKMDSIPTPKIAELLSKTGVPLSAARISQIRSAAAAKLADYMKFKGISSIESAKEKLNMEAAARMLLAVIKESIDLEISILDRYRKIPSDVMIEGKEIGINIIIDTNTMEAIDAVDRFNESILAKVPSASIDEARKAALYTMSDTYFSDIMETIIKVITEGSRNRSPEDYNYQQKKPLSKLVGVDQDDNMKYAVKGGIEYAAMTPQVESLIKKASDIKQISEYTYSYIFDDINDAKTFADLMGTSVEDYHDERFDERSDDIPFKNQ